MNRRRAQLFTTLERRYGASMEVPAREQEVRFNCPTCEKLGKTPDTKFHMYVNIIKMMFMCHRCGAKGGLTQLIGGIPPNTSMGFVDEWYDEVEAALNGEQQSMGKREEAKFPDGAVPVESDSFCAKYLLGRGLSIGLCWQLGMLDWREKFRVIVPTFFQGSCEYWVARSYLSGETPTYLNPDVPRRNVVFNLERAALERGPILICEGVFTALSLGPMAVATLGKYTTAQQVRRLLQAGGSRREYIVCYDSDAARESQRLAGLLARKGAGCVRVVDWSWLGPESSMERGMDLADLPAVARRRSVERALTHDWYTEVSSVLQDEEGQHASI